MKSGERDLLILLSQDDYSEAEIEKEAMLINDLLAFVETDDKLAFGVEVLDLHHNRVIRKASALGRYLNRKRQAPFSFLMHKN